MSAETYKSIQDIAKKHNCVTNLFMDGENIGVEIRNHKFERNKCVYCGLEVSQEFLKRFLDNVLEISDKELIDGTL